MIKTLLLIGGIVALTAISITGALLLTSFLSPPEEPTDPLHESTKASHSGPTNLSEAKIQDITRLNEVNISIVGADFQPNNIQIKKGTKVTWTNNGTENHAVMEENDDESSHEAASKDNVKEGILSGPTLAKGKTYEFTFNATGQVYYHCPLHPNVRGKVTVVE